MRKSFLLLAFLFSIFVASAEDFTGVLNLKLDMSLDDVNKIISDNNYECEKLKSGAFHLKKENLSFEGVELNFVGLTFTSENKVASIMLSIKNYKEPETIEKCKNIIMAIGEKYQGVKQTVYEKNDISFFINDFYFDLDVENNFSCFLIFRS